MKTKVKKLTKEVNLDKAIKDIKEMLFETHRIKNIKPSYGYKGEEIRHNSILHNSSNIKNSVSQKGIVYHTERHRDLIDVILMKTFQLGFSQAMIIKDNEKIKYPESDWLLQMFVKETKKLESENRKLKKKIKELDSRISSIGNRNRPLR